MTDAKRIFNNSNDVHVRAVCIYKKANDEFGYLDEEYTVKVGTEDLVDWFNKGMVHIVTDDGVFKGVSMLVEANVATVSYVTTSESAVTLGTIKSEASAA